MGVKFDVTRFGKNIKLWVQRAEENLRRRT